MRKYSVIEECGTLSEKKNGDSIKLRYLSWDNKEYICSLSQVPGTEPHKPLE